MLPHSYFVKQILYPVFHPIIIALPSLFYKKKTRLSAEILTKRPIPGARLWNFPRRGAIIKCGEPQETHTGKEGEKVHELAITQQILEFTLRTARERGAKRVTAIRLRLGPFSGVVPECIQIYLDVLARDTEAEGAKIETTWEPLRVKCLDCGLESEIDRRHIACPQCGSVRLHRLSGREFLIESLEVES